MESKTSVEIADRVSRRRAWIVALAALAFLVVQAVAPPFFVADPDTAAHLNRRVMWAITAVALLLGLATGGGLLNRRQIRSLVNDEVAREHAKASIVTGYWVAMVAAMGLYIVPVFQSITAREAVYLIVTPSIAVALLAFSYLEYRAHRDA